MLDGKIANLTKAVENGAAIDSLIAQLRDRQQECERLIATIAAAKAGAQPCCLAGFSARSVFTNDYQMTRVNLLRVGL